MSTTNSISTATPTYQTIERRPELDEARPHTSAPDGPRRPRRRLLQLVALGTIGATALIVAGAVGFTRSTDAPRSLPIAGADSAPFETTFRAGPGASLADTIEQLQTHLEVTPDDDVSWATLGLAYVQQARISVNPSFYPLAEGAIDRSFVVNDGDNFLGYAGRSALASARHEFLTARDFARDGLAINEYSALLWGALSDAETQLGNYDAATAAVQRMVDLTPDSSSLARVSYTWELQGDIGQASVLMQRSLEAAPTADDRAFALYFLGELAFGTGEYNEALSYYNQAFRAVPNDSAAQAGRARALAASGQIETALDAYAALVARVPDPAYLTGYGELLQSLGRGAEADEQFRIVTVTRQLYAANGVQPDGAEVLFLSDHGDPAEALELAEAAVEQRPFLAVHDAYAWALYRNGRYDEALVESNLALSTGIQNASFRYHAGMIQDALGNTQEAIADLTAAVELSPQFDPVGAGVARETLDRLVSS